MMQILRIVFLTGWFLTAWSLIAEAQDSQWTVCAGDTGIAYFVDGWENSTFNWNVEGGTITHHYGDTILVDWPHVPGSYSITVQETSESGCIGELKTGQVEVVGPVIDLGEDTYICDGEIFDVSPTGEFTSFLWNDGSTGPSFSTGQEGWISLSVTDSIGCILSDSIYLTVNNLPLVDLGKDTTLCGEQELILDGGSDGSFFDWSTGDISQTISIFNDGEQEIWVIVTDDNGCVSGDTIKVESPIDNCLTIPNAISPNGDRINDVWNIDQLNLYPNVEIKIFNRWGELIWVSQKGYPQPWDGTSNGRALPIDSYHYIIDLNNGTRPILGHITIIK